MKKTDRKTKPKARQRTPPVNRKLTKERVAAAMASLRSAGVAITTKALLAAAGGKGSNSTLIRLRKEIETERPELIQCPGISRAEAVAFIKGCARFDLPALEEALLARRQIIRYWQNFLCLEIHPGDEATAILEDLGATHRPYVGWTLEPTRWNYEKAKRYGFTSNVETDIMRELERIADRAARKR